MAITMKDVRFWLDPEEPDYIGAKRKLGKAAVPYLLELAQGADLGLASKATYLASMIRSEQSAAVLEAAATRNEPVLQVAVASGIRNLPAAKAENALDLVIGDPDPGVRKVALKSAGWFRSPRIVTKLQEMADTDPEPSIRELATDTVLEMKSKSK